jgi:acyl-CoA synthetase (AMP-forming)/AMP-acid ligase II
LLGQAADIHCTSGALSSFREIKTLAPFSSDRDARFANLIELLRARSAEHGPRIAFRFLADGETEESRLTYGELELRARSIAAALAPQAAAGDRALLF